MRNEVLRAEVPRTKPGDAEVRGFVRSTWYVVPLYLNGMV
jgi:hypothetical protein